MGRGQWNGRASPTTSVRHDAKQAAAALSLTPSPPNKEENKSSTVGKGEHRRSLALVHRRTRVPSLPTFLCFTLRVSVCTCAATSLVHTSSRSSNDDNVIPSKTVGEKKEGTGREKWRGEETLQTQREKESERERESINARKRSSVTANFSYIENNKPKKKGRRGGKEGGRAATGSSIHSQRKNKLTKALSL